MFLFLGLLFNGILLFWKIGIKVNYIDYGLVYRFLLLELYEEEKIF